MFWIELWLFFTFQILIVEAGGWAFSTAPLNLEQWIWCIFFGVGTLLWQQLITTIPNNLIPKSFSYVTNEALGMKGSVSNRMIFRMAGLAGNHLHLLLTLRISHNFFSIIEEAHWIPDQVRSSGLEVWQGYKLK